SERSAPAMVRLDDEIRPQTGVPQRSRRPFFVSPREKRSERRIEIPRPLRGADSKPLRVLSRCQQWRRKRRVSCRYFKRKTGRNGDGRIHLRSVRYATRGRREEV